MHVSLVLRGCWPLDKQQYLLHNWNINHMEKENEVENKPLKLFSWPAGFLLFTNFLHSTRNIFPFFFLVILPCSLFRTLLLARQNLMLSHDSKYTLVAFVLVTCCCSENRKFIVLFCTSFDTIMFFFSFNHLKDFSVIVRLK